MPETEPQIVLPVPAEISGDPRDLLTSVGSAEALPGIAAVVAGAGYNRVHDLPSLDEFLHRYLAEIMIPIELPAVLRSWQFTAANQLRELIDLDRDLLNDDRLKPFREASCAVGRRQLGKLRPLRDHRVIQRYWTAMDEGRAAAWHTLVYGLITSVYALPLRQSLIQLTQQTVAGFTMAAATDHRLSLDACRELLLRHNKLLSPAINEAIRKSPTTSGTLLFSDTPRLVIS